MTNAVKIITLPIKTNVDSWESVEQVFGIRRTGKPVTSSVAKTGSSEDNVKSPIVSQFLHQVELPAGWTIATSNVSRHQQWIVNADGIVVAKVFYKQYFDTGAVEFLAEGERFAKPEAEECHCQTCTCGS